LDSIDQKLRDRNVEAAKRERRAGRLSRREFMAWTAAWGVGAAVPVLAGAERGQAQSGGGTVNLLTGAGYMDNTLFGEFKQKTGITVNPLPWTSNEETFLKVKQEGGANIDISLADGWWPLLTYQAGLTEALSLSQFEGGKTIFPMFLQMPVFNLGGGKYVGFPYHWDYQTVIYRSDHVSPAPDSLGALFDPKYKGRIVWRDRGTEMINLTAKTLGIPVDRPEHPRQWFLTPDELNTVKNELIKAKKAVNPLFYKSNAEAVKMLAANEVDLAFASSFVAPAATKGGAPSRAMTKTKTNQKFTGYVDALLLLKNAAHRDAAIKLLDYLTSFRGRQIIFQRDAYPDVDKTVTDWAVNNGFKDMLEARGVLDPAQVVPNMQLIAPPTDLQAWVDAYNEVKAA
jgi:spermidine/putrescine-binding protein